MPSAREIAEFLNTDFPQTKCTVEQAGPNSATVRHPVGHAELRPGGTVAGPVLMETADVALYVAILATLGMVQLAVTTQLSINFLRKPPGDRAIVGVCTLIKLGRSQVVGE